MPPIYPFQQQPFKQPPVELPQIDGTAQSIKESRETVMAWWKREQSKQYDSLDTSFKYSAYVDHLLGCLFRLADEAYRGHGIRHDSRIAVMALGGYGRCEMGPYSDIDLMFLYHGDDDAYISALTSAILYPLWDAGMDVGVTTRTIDDCRSIVKNDVKALTSMLDARFVVGDKSLADDFQRFIIKWFFDEDVRRKFVRLKLAEYDRRKRDFGDSIYLLQPNVKESEGGLRDFHTLVWLTRATYPDGPLDGMLLQSGLSHRSIHELAESVKFLWRVRQALHLREGRRQDRLGEEHQHSVAKMLGFEDNSISSAAEQMMQAYYRHASIIHRYSQWAFERMGYRWTGRISRMLWSVKRWTPERGVSVRWGRRLSVNEEALIRDPILLLRSFVYAKRRGLLIDADTKELLSNYSTTIGDDLRNSDKAKSLWWKLFRSADHLGETISQMHECGCLEGWIPEMKPMIHRIQHDGFHVFTVDVHTINALNELSLLTNRQGLREHPVAAEAIRSLKRIYLVLIATLLHDIGKGHGRNHEEIGEGLARNVVRRMGFSKEDEEDIAFLVRSHMLMPKLAFRRDITDPSLIERFSQTVRTPSRLAMLFLVTYADLRSVGPHIWSAWKEGLLNDLYVKTREYLLAGGETEVHHQKLRGKRLRGALRILKNEVSLKDMDEFLASMPNRYALTMLPPQIATHFVMVKELSNLETVSCDVRNDHERGVSELSVVTGDSMGLFARIAGVLTANGLNIVDADLYTTKAGIAVDVIRITNLRHQPIEDPVRWQRIICELELVVDEKKIIPSLERRLGSRFRRRRRVGQPRIEVDNDVSATDTVLEIHSDDRPGLLYRISKVISERGFTIELARIATHVDRVIDVFYIRDGGGNKVSSMDQANALRDALADELIEGRRGS